MIQPKILDVFYHNRIVGRIAESNNRLLEFKYDDKWISNGFSISPFKLPLEDRIFNSLCYPFAGNFGIFNDSLPDSWGKLLTDQAVIKENNNPTKLSIIDRLAMVGVQGKGALEYGTVSYSNSINENYDIDNIATEAIKIFNGKYDGNIEEIAQIAKVSGGARPKVLLNLYGEDWIVKFRADNMDSEDIAELEMKYMNVAKEAGLETPEARLFNEKYFGVKRFDRKTCGEKVFMISLSGLLDTDHRMFSLDYNDIMDATLKLTNNRLEVEKMFRLMCFNVFAHNRDDHAKNFSFLYDKGLWKVSPVYDLVYASGTGGEHATSIDGESKNPTKENIISVAEKARLNKFRAAKIMNEVEDVVKHAKLF